MPKFSKEIRQLHKERVRQLLVVDTRLSVLSVQELLKKDKKQPLPLDKGYICNLIRDIKKEGIARIQCHEVTELLADVENQYLESRKHLWDIVAGPTIRHTAVSLPNPKFPDDPTKMQKKIITTKITNKERIEAMRLLKDLTKEFVNQLVIIGKIRGSDGIDPSLLNGSNITNNLTQINIENVTPEQLAREEKELRDDIESLKRQLSRYEECPKEAEIVEAVEIETGKVEPVVILEGEPAISGNASNNDGVPG